jgi:hypothetical protein
MFHKYDFGTASQISSRHWETESLEPERSLVLPLGIALVAIEICAMIALTLFPFHEMKAFQSETKNHNLASETQNHKMTSHGHHLSKHIG